MDSCNLCCRFQHSTLLQRSMEGLLQDWVELGKIEKSARTVNDYYILMGKQYIKIVGKHEIGEIDLHKIDQFKIGLKKNGLAHSTINIRLRTLKTFLNWCVDRDYLVKVPKIKMMLTVQKLPGVMSREDLKRLHEYIKTLITITKDPRRKHFYKLHERFFMVTSGTGCRLQEIFWLSWKDIDLKRSTITIRTTPSFTVKEKKEKVKILPLSVKKYLEIEREKKPREKYLLDNGCGQLAYKNPSALTRAFWRHLKTIGVSGVKAVHGFRASFATIMKNDLHIETDIIRDLLGHSSSKVTQGYFANIDRPQIAAIAALNRLEESSFSSPLLLS